MRRILVLLSAALGMYAGEPAAETAPPLVEYTHPVFKTPVSVGATTRPAVQVDIFDASEWWFSTAELYLAVHSSRFPDDTWVVLPLNLGEFDGAAKRFVQLPFEVREEDALVFNLLDEDGLTSGQALLLLEGCKATGYCLFRAGQAYAPAIAKIARPAIGAAAETVAKVIISDCDLHKFDNFGTAEFIVPAELPATPGRANKLTILDDGRYSRVELKIYGMEERLAANRAY